MRAPSNGSFLVRKKESTEKHQEAFAISFKYVVVTLTFINARSYHSEDFHNWFSIWKVVDLCYWYSPPRSPPSTFPYFPLPHLPSPTSPNLPPPPLTSPHLPSLHLPSPPLIPLPSPHLPSPHLPSPRPTSPTMMFFCKEISLHLWKNELLKN